MITMTLGSALPTVQLELEWSPVQKGTESYVTDHTHAPTQTNTVKHRQRSVDSAGNVLIVL